MAGSETGLSDLMDNLDLGDVDDTGYERDIDVEVIGGFYHQNVAFMNEKFHFFADFWMRLYSECCLQRDYAEQLLNDGKPEEPKAILQDWPSTMGSPNIPQLLFEGEPGRKRKKRTNNLSIESDGAMLVMEMKGSYISGERVHFDVPNVLPEGDVSLAEYETHIQECDNCFKTVENYVVQNAFVYGAWLSQAFDKFQEEKPAKLVSGNFDDWVDLRCKVKSQERDNVGCFTSCFILINISCPQG